MCKVVAMGYGELEALIVSPRGSSATVKRTQSRLTKTIEQTLPTKHKLRCVLSRGCSPLLQMVGMNGWTLFQMYK